MNLNNAPARPDPAIGSNISQRVWEFPDLVLKTRFAQALHDAASSYAIHRDVRLAVRCELEDLFDRLALQARWRVQRLGSSKMILDAEGLFVAAYGSRKVGYCSCVFQVWADTVARADEARAAFLAEAGTARITEPMFSIDWHFLRSNGELESASIEEMADDVLFDCAYPAIEGGIAAFIDRYLASPETVLVLQGPPGTGKTRLIRAVLGEMSRRNGGAAQALYTGDKKALESDEIFVKFITGWDDAFVVEDADHLLKARAAGNEHIHRFLAIADGVVRAQGRKIIFSTNLPNVGDLDDALTRAGRCFAQVLVRELSRAESQVLVRAICAGDGEGTAAAMGRLNAAERKSVSLAEVYKLVDGAPLPA